tara:strand:- start:438 stop:1175 length:738 start_codon:yes stop_codon:yes gene_type:complete
MNLRKKDSIVLLCSHGSRALAHSKNLENLTKKINKDLKFKVLSCYLEKNNPSLKKSIESNIKIYNKIIIFPFLIFEGIHFVNDIKLLIKKFSERNIKKIFLVKKLSLMDEILPLTSQTFIEMFTQRKGLILVTSSSFSKKKSVISDLEKYTKLLAKNLGIKSYYFHFSGDEKNIIEKIKTDYSVENCSIFFHPLFLFDGYLYQKSLTIFNDAFKSDLRVADPLMNQTKIYKLVVEKLINRIQTID